MSSSPPPPPPSTPCPTPRSPNSFRISPSEPSPSAPAAFPRCPPTKYSSVRRRPRRPASRNAPEIHASSSPPLFSSPSPPSFSAPSASSSTSRRIRRACSASDTARPPRAASSRGGTRAFEFLPALAASGSAASRRRPPGGTTGSSPGRVCGGLPARPRWAWRRGVSVETASGLAGRGAALIGRIRGRRGRPAVPWNA